MHDKEIYDQRSQQSGHTLGSDNVKDGLAKLGKLAWERFVDRKFIFSKVNLINVSCEKTTLLVYTFEPN